MAASEADVAAQLIERLLADQAFRVRFRRDPAAACREAGLDGLADEMSLGAGKAMMTLDVRESKSSLAGVMMAAAMEGVGLYEFSRNVLPHLENVPSAVGDVLSRVNLPAVGGALAPAPAASAAAVEAPDEAAGAGGGAAGAAAVGGGAAAAQAAAPVAPPEAAPEEAAAGGKGAEGEGAAKNGAAEKAVPPEVAAAQAIAQAESPEAQQKEAAAEAVAKIAEETDDLPDQNALPDGPVKLASAPEDPKGAKPPEQAAAPAAAAPAAPAAPAPAAGQVAPAPAAPVAPAPAGGSSEPIDAGQFGAEGTGTGGEPTPEGLAILKNEKVIFDDVGVADIKAGRIDPRIIAVLTKLSQEHEITVSCMCSDHSKFTSGGSISNHHFGRGLDIAAVDGVPVNASNFDAREIAMELQEFDTSIRPNEIGTPWAIAGPGYFTDAGHQDHLHVGFKQEIAPDWKPPAELAAGAQPAAAAATAAAAPGAPAAAAAAVPGQPPAPQRTDSLTFAALTPKQAAAAAADTTGAKPAKGSDSLAFIKAVQQPQQPAAAAAAAPEAAAATAGAVTGPTSYPGDDAPREQLAAWMAAEAQKRGIPPELPVMAALVESNLENVKFGHADSLGFFQMRTSIWDQGDYKGFSEDPSKQIDWFLDTAEGVMDQRKAAGLPIDDPSQFGEWVADVERPAEEYRGRYQTRLEEAKTLLEDARAQPAPAAPAAQAAPAPAAGAPAAGGVVEAAAGAPATGKDAAKALLSNPNLDLPEGARKDLAEGVVDPRLVEVLGKLASKHEIGLSVIKTGHDQFTSGGSVSNHFVGRGIDIATVDGQPVNVANAAAREIATELAALTGAVRPTEIGTPWAISASGFFTDAGHQDHLHVAFDGEPPAGFQPSAAAAPAAAAPAQAVAAPAAAAVAGQPAAPAAPQRTDSLTFAAITPKQAAAAAADAAGATPAKGSDSLAFIKAVQPAGPASAVAPPAAAVPGAVADAAAATAAGGSQLGSSALEVAMGELGVREVGNNTGADVEKYLEAADVPPGSPWCASFITWAMEQAGHKMEGGGWAAVQTWVRNAEEGNFDLEIVDAEDARPGDLVAYDWGGGDDFAGDGHIGFVASEVDGGKFTALEGNWQDAVTKVPRQLGSDGTNMKFIRIKGLDAPAVPPVAPATPPSGVEGSVQAAAEAAAGAAPTGAGAKALAALEEAKKHLGTPYQWGGSTPETNFDCSGLVQWSYAQAGIQIPRVTDDQVQAPNGKEVGRDELLPGDLVFFANGDDVYHVGMSLGGDKFIHAPSTGDVVKVSSLNESYFAENYYEARRFDDATGAAPAQPAAAAPAAAAAAPAAPAIDPTAVAKAQAAVARDAAEVRRHDSLLFKAVTAQEASKARATVQFLKAIKPEEAAAAAAAQPVVPPEAAAAAPAGEAAAPAGPAADLSGVESDYPGNDASQAELAKWLAKQAQEAGLPPELPVMAALVESGVKNLNYGHADSVGFFQMRTAYWNSGPYAGYPERPELQAKWFIDQALAIKKKRIGAGAVDFGKDPAGWGEWIADVELPAEEYRGRYQLRLAEARRLLA